MEKRKKILLNQQARFLRTKDKKQEIKPLKKVRFHNLNNNKKDNVRARKVFLFAQRKMKQKQLKDFENILDDIRRRGATFTKLGFTSEQKRNHKKLIGDVFHLKHQDDKGTMTVTELWSNKQRSHFLKQNRIKMNKMKMLQKLTKIKKGMQKSINNLKSIDSFRSINSIKQTKDCYESFKSISNIRHSDDSIQLERIKKNQFNFNIIQNNLATLQNFESMKDLRGKIKTLQDFTYKMQGMQRNYFENLIQML